MVGQITIYERGTGSPLRVWPIDAAELVAQGGYVRTKEMVSSDAGGSEKTVHPRARAVVIEGITYPSITMAEETLGLSRHIIGRRLQAGQYQYAEEASWPSA